MREYALTKCKYIYIYMKIKERTPSRKGKF
jgi:hypothetical protein